MSHKVQVETGHYFSQKYDHKARWLSYWYQVNEVMRGEPKIVLEVGPGNNTVTDYLRKLGIEVKTLDIDASLKPDIAASVTSVPVPDNSFDCVLAAEILEHLPYEESQKAMREIYRVTKKHAIISVPDSRRTLFYFALHLPVLGRKEIFWKWDDQREHKFDGQHYWEIGKKDYPLERIKKSLVAAGFKLISDFVPTDVPTKHFFVLEKI